MNIKRLVLASIALSLTVMLVCCILLYVQHQPQQIVSYTATIVPFS